MWSEQRLLDIGDRNLFWDAQAWSNRVLYCTCRHTVLVRNVPEGLVEQPHFYSTDNYVREITTCPGCGRVLAEVDLTPSLPDEI